MVSDRISVMQIIDSLEYGGAERMAVNLANLLPRDQYVSHLCTTRGEGPLAKAVQRDVGRLSLFRTSRLREPRAILEMLRYVRTHNIRILHCHQKTIFLCSIISVVQPTISIIWHDHFGPVTRSRWLYRIGTRRAKAIITVSEELTTWAKQILKFEADRVYFVNNFVLPPNADQESSMRQNTGLRIVCTANISPDKDTINLVRAISLVIQEEPEIQVLIIGRPRYTDYFQYVQKEISDRQLQDHIKFLGSRDDVAEILQQCDIGVLSSKSEGLPLALIEYGMAGLATVATRVGQCADVLGNGQYGIVVPSSDPRSLAAAIVRLIQSKSDRAHFGRQLKKITIENYGPDKNMRRIVDIYSRVL